MGRFNVKSISEETQILQNEAREFFAGKYNIKGAYSV